MSDEPMKNMRERGINSHQLSLSLHLQSVEDLELLLVRGTLITN